MNAPAKVLIIGDSISIGYTPHVAEALAGQTEVAHNPGNGGDSANVLAHLEEWLGPGPFAVVHFNCGLHDVKVPRDRADRQVPIEQYRRNLEQIVARLAGTGARLIWASSTPVIEAWHTARKEFDRHNRDIQAYNAVAEDIMRPAGVAINDLHALAASAGPEELLTPDGVHFTEAGYRLLGEAVAESIRRALG